ncbi:hypothetical protein ILUMI_05940 [Ignelater luminosus]|uniref:Uncharacterized protein n=1 Tax=Ignelater luminosus TaxID=2038154 RepID=A0A8K0DBN7_IGNLU|nr:hypothetical protein ILUMI_05940 [Ignelater luminosus]
MGDSTRLWRILNDLFGMKKAEDKTVMFKELVDDSQEIAQKLNAYYVDSKEEYNVMGDILDWLSSYLSYRQQCVKYSSVKSDLVLVEHGVPPGNNFVKLKEVMHNLKEDPASVTKVKTLLSETAIVKELVFIKSYIEFLSDVTEALKTRGMTIKDQLGKLSFVEEKLKIVPGKEERVFRQKFENDLETIPD